MKVIECASRNAKRLLLFQVRLLACASFISHAFIEPERPCPPINYQTMSSPDNADFSVFFSNIISRNREILRKITQNCGSGAVSFTKLHNLTPTKKFTRLVMIYTPVSKALKSANDNSRTRVAACS